MPFKIQEPNLSNVLSQFLRPNEKPLIVFPADRRVVGLTDESRLLVTSFPFFFKPKLLHDVSVSAITSWNSMRYGAMNCRLDIGAGPDSFSLDFAVPPGFVFPVKEKLDELIERITQLNPAVRPAHLEEGERILFSQPLDKGILRLTDRGIQLLDTPAKNQPTKPPAIISLASVSAVDSYPKDEFSTILFLQETSGQRHHFKIGGAAKLLIPGLAGEPTAPANPAEAIQEAMAHLGRKARPSYLEDGERILVTMPCAHSSVGTVLSSNVLRLTSKRLLDLKPSKDGSLELEATIPLSEIAKVKLGSSYSTGGGVKGNDWAVKVTLHDGRKLDYWAGDSWEKAATAIVQNIERAVGQ